jgi:hypothetical protein
MLDTNLLEVRQWVLLWHQALRAGLRCCNGRVCWQVTAVTTVAATPAS